MVRIGEDGELGRARDLDVGGPLTEFHGDLLEHAGETDLLDARLCHAGLETRDGQQVFDDPVEMVRLAAYRPHELALVVFADPVPRLGEGGCEAHHRRERAAEIVGRDSDEVAQRLVGRLQHRVGLLDLQVGGIELRCDALGDGLRLEPGAVLPIEARAQPVRLPVPHGLHDTY